MYAMEYGKAFAFMTDDEKWITKLLLASVMVFVPVLGGFLLIGYSLEITRRVIKSQTPLLPEWSDFGVFLKSGFLAFVVLFLYSLPAALLAAFAEGPQIAVLSGDSFDETFLMAANAVSVCCACLTCVVGLVSALLTPAAIGRLADTGRLGSAFQLGELFTLVRTKPGVYLMTLIVISVVGLVLAPIGLLICFVGLFPVIAYLYIAAGHLYGQAYRVAASEAGLLTSASAPVSEPSPA